MEKKFPLDPQHSHFRLTPEFVLDLVQHTDNSFHDLFDESTVRTERFTIRCFGLAVPQVQTRMSVGTGHPPYLVHKLLDQM